MYTEFYHLKEKPFNLSPSSRFLYLGEIHKEALALLTYGVVERKGFVLLTGEVGTGKTTMVQALINNLDKSVQYVHLNNPLLSSKDFIDYLAFSVFRRRHHVSSKSDFLIEFEAFLRDCLQHQKNFLIIIDEAQKLSFDLLEEIRLLSNMETADEKLVNIFLVGQPELNQKLSDTRCRALQQRISIRYHINPLDLKETSEYITKRLKIAGLENSEKLFPKNTLKAIHQYSEGYPRVINVLSDNVLLLGYTQEKRTITPSMVRECYQDIKVENGAPREKTGPMPPPEVEEIEKPHRRSLWIWLPIFVIIIAMGYVSVKMRPDILNRVKEMATIGRQRDGRVTTEPAAEGKKDIEVPEGGRRVIYGKVLGKEGEKTPESEGASSRSPASAPDADAGLKDTDRPEPPVVQEKGIGGGATESDKNVEKEAKPEAKPSEYAVIVKRGDTLSGLAGKFYDRLDDKVLEWIKANNPGLKNLDRIEIGQKIFFPPLQDKRPVAE